VTFRIVSGFSTIRQEPRNKQFIYSVVPWRLVCHLSEPKVTDTARRGRIKVIAEREIARSRHGGEVYLIRSIGEAEGPTNGLPRKGEGADTWRTRMGGRISDPCHKSAANESLPGFGLAPKLFVGNQSRLPLFTPRGSGDG